MNRQLKVLGSFRFANVFETGSGHGRRGHHQPGWNCHRDSTVSTKFPEAMQRALSKDRVMKIQVASVKYRSLGNTGLNVSSLSFGASSLGGVFHEVDEDRGDPRRARRARPRHQLLRRRPGLRRHALGDGAGQGAPGHPARPLFPLHQSRQIHRTRASTATTRSTTRGDRIRRSIDESAARLGTDYFDIIHLHDIEYQDRRHTEWALDRGLRGRLGTESAKDASAR